MAVENVSYLPSTNLFVSVKVLTFPEEGNVMQACGFGCGF
jgi:hypothetical protein